MTSTSTAGVVAVVGPTATGKSALALELAERLGGEIVNADSMQLYRGMDIGTAKLPPSQRRGIVHHLLDVWDVRRTASVADYQALAQTTVDALRARGVTPILVGGSGLYVRAVLDDLTFPGTDPAIRARLEGELARDGVGVLGDRLRRIDPVAAGRIGENPRRIVRALEVNELTGGPWQAELPDYAPIDGCVQIGLDLPGTDLDERIAQRVRAMFDGGLLEEVRDLEQTGLREGVTASRALGYAQALAVLDGELDQALAERRTIQATRRFVRRQRSWFRRDPRIRWLDGRSGADDALAVVADG